MFLFRSNIVYMKAAPNLILHSLLNPTFPTLKPSSLPSLAPSTLPSNQPSSRPSLQPSMMPSLMPSLMPSDKPSLRPSEMPSTIPSENLSLQPSEMPSSIPSDNPSLQPSGIPPSTIPSQNPFLDHLELFHFRTRDDRFLTAESCTAGANIVLLQEIKRSDSLSDPTLPWTQIWRISDGRLINACSTSDLSIVITIVSDLGVGGVRTLQEISGAQFQLAPESAINDHFELEFISDGGVSIKYTPIFTAGGLEYFLASGAEGADLKLSGTCDQFE